MTFYLLHCKSKLSYIVLLLGQFTGGLQNAHTQDSQAIGFHAVL